MVNRVAVRVLDAGVEAFCDCCLQIDRGLKIGRGLQTDHSIQIGRGLQANHGLQTMWRPMSIPRLWFPTFDFKKVFGAAVLRPLASNFLTPGPPARAYR